MDDNVAVPTVAAVGTAHSVGYLFDLPRTIVPYMQTERDVSGLADAALAYARMGLAVVPLHTPLPDGGCSCGKQGCKHPGKHPRTPNGHKDATTDLAQIERWWQCWPDANIGVVPGSAGMSVLDIDQHSVKFGPDAQALLEQLRAEHPTPEAISGSGSTHMWFRLREGECYDNYTGTLPRGIDVRSSGGLIVVAPSLHYSGRHYAWADGGELPDLSAIAPLPDFVREMLQAERKGHSRRKVVFTSATTFKPDLAALGLPSGLIKKIHTVSPKGQRSESDFGVACGLVRAGRDDDTIRAIFQHYPIGISGKYAEKRKSGD